MRDKKLIFVVVGSFFIYSLLCLNLVLASVIIGNDSGSVELIYGPGQQIKGWINLSFTNEDVNSVLSYFDQNITLLDFLNNNSESNFNCTPNDCKDYYEATTGNANKNFSLNKDESRTIGLKFQKKLLESPVQMISFKINSSAGTSCNQQLKIDVGDDGEMDWIPLTSIDDFSCSKSWGCYDSLQNIIEYDIGTTSYCEKIRVPGLRSFKIGANIIKGTTSSPGLKMQVYDMDSNQIGGCDITTPTSSGEVSCRVDLGLENQSDIYVCIKADLQTDYRIKSENAGVVCGFYDIENHQGNSDYSIFAQGGKYAQMGGFVFDDNSFKNYESDKGDNALKEHLNNYIDMKYDNNCENICVIPVKFISGENQQITLSNLVLKYNTNTGVLNENNLYDVNKKTAKISSGFLRLDLEKADFFAPSQTGNVTFSLRFGENVILRREIMIKWVPEILGISPINPPALVPVNFLVVMNTSEKNMTYTWNFGDNTNEETTTSKIIKHTYQTIGIYQLTVKASGKNGETSKTFQINVVSPKSLINQTITDYKEDLKNVEGQISTLPGWIKKEVEDKAKLDDIKNEIDAQEKKYQEGFIDDSKAVEIMGALNELKVPEKFYASRIVDKSMFLMSEEQLDIDLLSELGAGKVDNEKEDYFKAINNWIRDNLKITIDSKIYSFSYKDKPVEDLYSYIKISIEPKGISKDLYFIVNGNPDDTKFNGENIKKIEEKAAGIALSGLKETKIIEFLYPEEIDVLNLPFYLSPSFKYLDLSQVLMCNLNGICEKELDETYTNCSDCKKPWLLKAIILILVLLFIAFIVYIILQEWYKRHYEGSLFKDKNQLFNLIHFMNSSEIQGYSKNDIFAKLRQMGWSSEQLDYAWKKLHGKRTGMWEIPIFKGAENKQVKEEIKKREGKDRKSIYP